MSTALKTKINKVQFLLSPLEKAYFGELVISGSLTVQGQNLLSEKIDQILEDEKKILTRLKNQKIAILKKLENFIVHDYKKMMKKAKKKFEESLNSIDLDIIETKLKNI